MRLDLNLATRPYQDARKFFSRWLPPLGALALVTVLLAVLALMRMRDVRALDRQIAEKKDQIAQLEKQKAHAEEILNQPQNAGTREQARFLNALFARKSFSWTQVLADLERLMPERVQVRSIIPSLTRDNRISVSMSVVSKERKNAIELVRRLETSSRFASPQVKAEAETGEEADEVRFEIVAYYIPESAMQERQ